MKEPDASLTVTLTAPVSSCASKLPARKMEDSAKVLETGRFLGIVASLEFCLARLYSTAQPSAIADGFALSGCKRSQNKTEENVRERSMAHAGDTRSRLFLNKKRPTFPNV